MESEANRADVPILISWYVSATDHKGRFTFLALRCVLAPASAYVIRDKFTRYRAFPIH